MRTLVPAAGRQRLQRRCRTGLLCAPPRHHPGRGDLRWWWWCQPGGPRRWGGWPARACQRVDPHRRGARGSPCPGIVQHGRQAPLPWQGRRWICPRSCSGADGQAAAGSSVLSTRAGADGGHYLW